MEQTNNVVPASEGAKFMSDFELINHILTVGPNRRYRQELRDRTLATKKLVFCARFNANRRTNQLSVFTAFMGHYSEEKLEWMLPKPTVFSQN